MAGGQLALEKDAEEAAKVRMKEEAATECCH